MSRPNCVRITVRNPSESDRIALVRRPKPNEGSLDPVRSDARTLAERHAAFAPVRKSLWT